jgi:two-component system, LuxR family, response regulator FixJ
MKEVGMAPRDIYVVDDDTSVRDALSVVLSLEGFHVSGFAEGNSFLAALRQHRPDCIILDVHMPGRSGLDILKELRNQHSEVPLFIISGQGDIPMAVDAIKNGALDFIEKPFNAETLVARVREAIAAAARLKVQPPSGPGLAARFPGRDLLTPREFQVLGLIANGASNKEAGRHLGISPRTIEVHRARIMEKLGAKNTVDLMHIVLSDRG